MSQFLRANRIYVTVHQRVSIAAFSILEVLWESSHVHFTYLHLLQYKTNTSYSHPTTWHWASFQATKQPAISVTTHYGISPVSQTFTWFAVCHMHFLPISLAFPFQLSSVAPPSLTVLKCQSGLCSILQFLFSRDIPPWESSSFLGHYISQHCWCSCLYLQFGALICRLLHPTSF